MGRGRLVTAWLVVVLSAIVIAVPAVLVAVGVDDIRWIAVGTTVAAAVSATVGKFFGDRLTRSDGQRDAAVLHLATRSLGGGRYRMQQVRDATVLGVHPSILDDRQARPGTPQRLPPYVRRDRHDDIVRNLAPGSFVIVIGDSAAGKTRTAFEAVKATMPEHLVVAPQSRAELAAALNAAAVRRNAVLWLDDLERFLGADGLTVGTIDRLRTGRRHHRVIVATLRISELLSLEVDDPERRWNVEQRRVLDQAVQIRLERHFSGDEIARAATLRWDPRINDALRHRGEFGVAEYLAAAPRLLDDWRNAWSPGAHPRAAALVAAAIECRRAGYLTPLPKALLEETHTECLAERGGSRLRPEPLADAWAWATAAKHATTTSLLERTDGGYLVFDYLIDHVQRTSGPDRPAAKSIIAAALRHADAPTSHDIARIAYGHGQYDSAQDAFQRAVDLYSDESGPEGRDTLTCRNELARVLARRGRLDDAVREHKDVVAARTRVLGPDDPETLKSRNYLARTLSKQDRLDEAIAEFRAVLTTRVRVLGPEHPDTLNTRGSLAGLLAQRGEIEFATRELALVLEARHQTLGPEHPYTLITRNDQAGLLAIQGELRRAASEFDDVIEARVRLLGARHPDTLASHHDLARTHAQMGDITRAAAEFRLVLDARIQILGPDHPDTASTRDELAKLQSTGDTAQQN